MSRIALGLRRAMGFALHWFQRGETAEEVTTRMERHPETSFLRPQQVVAVLTEAERNYRASSRAAGLTGGHTLAEALPEEARTGVTVGVRVRIVAEIPGRRPMVVSVTINTGGEASYDELATAALDFARSNPAVWGHDTPGLTDAVLGAEIQQVVIGGLENARLNLAVRP